MATTKDTAIPVQIIPFEQEYTEQVVDLIIKIQAVEFKVKITAQDQPDLLEIPHYYQQKGNFWIAINDDRVLGTLALANINNNQVALRKMFVKQGYRSKPLNIAHKLMQTALKWCGKHEITDVFLGTVPTYHAAHRFYEKNGFVRIEEETLPKGFSIMAVDKYFYQLNLRQ